jgi:hypothetical protein
LKLNTTIVKERLTRLGRWMRGVVTDAYRKFSIKDPIGIGGVVSFWYGLHLYSDSVAYTVTGILLMILSLVIKEKQ